MNIIAYLSRQRFSLKLKQRQIYLSIQVYFIKNSKSELIRFGKSRHTFITDKASSTFFNA